LLKLLLLLSQRTSLMRHITVMSFIFTFSCRFADEGCWEKNLGSAAHKLTIYVPYRSSICWGYWSILL